MWIPDVRTIFFLLVLFDIFLILILFTFWKTQKTYPGYLTWIFSMLALTLGYILLLPRGYISDFLSVVVANTLLALMLLLRIDASSRYFRSKPLPLQWYGLLIPFAGLFACFLYGMDSFMIRSLILNAAIIACLCAFSIIVLRVQDQETRTLRRGLVAALLIMAVLMTVRNIFWLFNPALQNLLNEEPVTIFLFLGAIITDLLGTGFFLALNMARAQRELQESRDALHESEKRYRDMFEINNAVMMVVDPDTGRITDANQAACRYYGYTHDEITRLPVTQINMKDPENMRNDLDRARVGDGTVFQSRHRKNDGELRDVEIFTGPVVTGGHTFLFSIIHDITERKAAENLLKRFNEELEEKVRVRTEELNASLQEKVLLLQEVHHRVKNNLQIIISLINIQARTISDPNTLLALQETRSRIRAISLVHEKLYREKDVARISLGSYTRNLVNSVMTAIGGKTGSIRTVIDIPDAALDIETAVPVGLILNELITNAFKHAFPDGETGTLTISGRSDGECLTLAVKDTGPGFPENFDISTVHSIGIHMVGVLMEQVRGSLELKNENGALVTMKIPLRKRNNHQG